ncbi:MAG: HAD family phosphatase [Chloroflexota bacterium]
MIRTAVLFDMDGLMVDTEPLARRSWERVTADFGVTMSDELFNRMLGRRTVESAQMVLEELPIPLSPDELVERKTAEYLSSLDGSVPAMPGLWFLLDRLDRENIPWAVATSTPRAVAEIVLGKLGVDGRYQALACGDEVKHGKPAPDIFLLAAERLGVSPEACLALEDSATGCAAAATAGMRVIAVPAEFTAGGNFTCAYHVYPSLVEVAQDLSELLKNPAVG